MRKRKREYGTYVDETTGEVSTVQSTKQAKRNHQKSGKWYKEPTEKEIRAWDREEQRQKAADKAARREENRKINATKRAEKEAKEHETKQNLFEAGKITFTQTLAKKDEDQMNLHSWFGRGRPQPSKQKRLSQEAGDENSHKQNKEHGRIARSHTGHEDVGACSQGSSCQGDSKRNLGSVLDKQKSIVAKVATTYMANRRKDIYQSHPLSDHDPMDLSQDFDIVEDSDAETEVLDEEDQPVEQHEDTRFKIPDLPVQSRRPPLSPMSKSDLNIRAGQTVQVNSFNSKLEKAKTSFPPNTQAVRDILSGICTQDLNDDLDEDILSQDKENEDPVPNSSSSTLKLSFNKHDSFSSPKHTTSAYHARSPEQYNQTSFVTVCDSFDYDSIFAALGEEETTTTFANTIDDFDDSGLDDATLLSLPATQLTSSTKPAAKTVHKPFKKIDSFAVEGLDDEDLGQALDEFERSQKHKLAATPSTASTFRKKKRVLPWDRTHTDYTAPAEEQEEAEEVQSMHMDDEELDGHIYTQSTGLLPSSA